LGDFAIRLAVVKVALAITGVALGAATTPRAHAQQVAPSRVTPESLLPAAPPPPQINLTAPAGLTPPPDALNLQVQVAHVDVGGTFPGFEGRTAAILDPLLGHRVSVAHIYELANDLERAYSDAGYFLARIVIPPQQLVDGGTLHLTVIDGVIERIDVKDVPESQRAVVSDRMAPIVGLHHVTLDDIERRLLLASDVPGLQLRSTLSAGDKPGTTLVVLQGTHSYATGTLGFDNRLPASLGTFAMNGSAALNSVFGLGEQTYFSITESPQIAPPQLRVLGGGFVLPIGNDGFTVNPEYTNSLARPNPPGGTPATQGDFQRLSFRANYPVIRTRAQNLNLQGSVEWENEQLVPIGFPTRLYSDDYEAARLRTVYTIFLDPSTPLQLTGTLSHGLSGRTATSTLPLSRLGASPTFTSASIEASLQYSLPASLQLAVTGRTQTSFGTPLMLSEQFSLDGLTALSAFADGAFSVDQGATLRVEISRSLTVPIAGQGFALSPYVFGAGGWGQLVMPTAVEHRDIGAGSAGFGLRTDTAVTGLAGASLAVEFGRKFSDVPTVPAGYRANLSVNLRF
jgi:hemolysin activation/secretion protein